jgi:hypothetical protein
MVIWGDAAVQRDRKHNLNRSRLLLIGAILAIACGVAVGACGDGRDASPTASRSVLTVDEQRGTVKSVTLGDSPASVRRMWGSPARGNVGASFAGSAIPLGSDDDGGLPGGPSPRPVRPGDRFGALRYPGASAVYSSRHGVFLIIVTDRRARTLKGVSIGDTLADAQRTYPGLQCGHRDARAEHSATDYCREHLPNGLWLWLGQDPIETISISRTIPLPG